MKHVNPGKIFADQDGVSVTEFGLIAPALFTMLLGTMDVGHTLYMRTVIDGAIQEVARDSSLEDGGILAKQQAIDARIKRQIRNLNKSINPASDIVIKRRYYRNFTGAFNADEEDYTDTNDNGVCDNGEPYIDANLNESWDSDGGDEGQGGAKDVSIVTVTVTYDRLFPVAGLIGLPEQITISANTVLANQPYAEQASYAAPQTRNCDD
ncbi:TadE family protein [Sphingorhabdus sp.]|uniref:TadE/TadG family type IV pilus assembly protein n=1 Tax=Sphingorhabdus sp. TaxID=1902408 RepID=UPI0032B8143F